MVGHLCVDVAEGWATVLILLIAAAVQNIRICANMHVTSIYMRVAI